MGIIRFDRKSGAYTDGKYYVKASFIREYAKSKLGISQERGRLSRAVLAAYFLDVHGVSANVE
jgi:hypothetical protein